MVYLESFDILFKLIVPLALSPDICGLVITEQYMLLHECTSILLNKQGKMVR